MHPQLGQYCPSNRLLGSISLPQILQIIKPLLLPKYIGILYHFFIFFSSSLRFCYHLRDIIYTICKPVFIDEYINSISVGLIMKDYVELEDEDQVAEAYEAQT